MKRLVYVVPALALMAACGSKKQKRSSSEEEEGGCRLPRETSKVEDIAIGKTAQVPAPLTGIKLGMTIDQAKAACPNLFKDAEPRDKARPSWSEIVGKFGDTYVHARLEFDQGKLDEVELTAPPAIAQALTAAWGAPQKSAGKESLLWIDPATRTRALLGPDERGERELRISSYIPVTELIEADTKNVAFKPQDVLGKTPAELVKQFPQFAGASTVSESTRQATDKMMEGMKKDLEAKGVKVNAQRDDVEVKLPGTAYGPDTRTSVVLYLDNETGTIRSYGLWFRSETLMSGSTWPQLQAEVLKQLDALWGPHKMVKETLGDRHVWYDAKRGVRASARVEANKPGELDLVFVKYTPLAKLFGQPGALWGFEAGAKALLGQAADDLASAYGAAYKLGTGDTATIKLPPTDYDGDTSVTTILLFLDGGKVREWHLGLPFADYEGARAEYEALLKAKFGDGKPGEREHLVFSKAPKVDARFTDITHELELEVTAK